MNVTSKSANFTNDPLSGQTNHQGRAVVTLQGRAESPDKELVRFGLRANLEGLRGLDVHVWLLLLLLLLWRLTHQLQLAIPLF